MELLLYVVTSATMLIVIVLFLATILEARVKNQTIAEVDQQGLRAMELMTQAIRNARAIGAPATSTSAASLTLHVLTPANDPTIFDLATGTLRIKEGAAAPIALTNSRVSVSSLSFQNLSRNLTPGTLRITFTLSYVNTTGRREYQYTKSFVGSASLRQP